MCRDLVGLDAGLVEESTAGELVEILAGVYRGIHRRLPHAVRERMTTFSFRGSRKASLRQLVLNELPGTCMSRGIVRFSHAVFHKPDCSTLKKIEQTSASNNFILG